MIRGATQLGRYLVLSPDIRELFQGKPISLSRVFASFPNLVRINLADTCIDDRAFDTIGSHCKGLQVILMQMVIEIRIIRIRRKMIGIRIMMMLKIIHDKILQVLDNMIMILSK